MINDPFIELIKNFLESEFSVGFEQEAFKEIGSLTEEQISLFYYQLSSLDEAQHNAMIVRDIHSNGLDKQEQNISFEKPYSAMFTHPYNGLETPSLDELKRQLLFFNKVAIIVPNARSCANDLQSQRGSFLDLLRSYMQILPLVESGSVELLPMSGFYSNEIEGGAGLIRQACVEDDKLARWIDANKSSLGDFSKSARKGDPYFDAGIRIASAVSYGHNLAATHPFVGGLYNEIFGEENQTPNLSKIETVRNINKINLPGLSGFDWADVVSIRKNEDALNDWRINLHAAISSIDPYLPPDRFIERFNSQVPAQLAQEANKLNEKLKQNSSMSRFRKGLSEVTISALGAVITGNPSGPIDKLWEGVCTVAKAEGAKQALNYLRGSREPSSAKVLNSHYAVFNTPKTRI